MKMLFLRIFFVVATSIGVCLSQTQKDDVSSSNKRSIEIISDTVAINSHESFIKDELVSKDLYEKIAYSIKLVSGEPCKRDLNTTLWALLNRASWAVAMYDSSVKAPVGIESGSVYQFGNFDECVNSGNDVIAITANHDDHQRHYPHVLPKYCLADVTITGLSVKTIASRKYQRKNETTVHWGICVPRTCDASDIQIFMTNLLDRETHVSDDNCYYNEEFQITNGMIIYICVILCFVLMVFLCTVYDVYLLTRKAVYKLPPAGCLEMVIKSFSAIENLKKLVQRSHDQMGLNAINGIKAASMLLIICGHSLLFIVGGPVMNSEFYSNDVKEIQNGFLLNSPLFVDTFLLLSGFLFCRILLKELEKRDGKINAIILYVCRYIRLTPAYFAVIAFYMTWLPYIGSGPLWKSRIVLEQQRCESSWWLNILYVNNYFGTEKLCMFQSWYLSVDTQLFIIAPAVIYLLWKRRKNGVHLLSFLVAVTAIFPFAITYVMDWDPTLLTFADEVSDISTNKFFIETYIKTHMRATAYVFGMLTGFLVHYIQEKQIKFPKLAVIVLWIVSVIVGILSMFSISYFYIFPFGRIESALYAGLHRLGWSFFTSWVVLSVITDNAGFLKSILSSSVFIPLSRLTYCAYLTNGIVELYLRGTLRAPVYMSRTKLLGEVTAHTALTFLLAIVLCLLFESPIHGIEKIFLRRDIQRRQNNQRKQERSPSTSDEVA